MSRVETHDVVAYLDVMLDTVGTPDYPNAVNGLQLANGGTVTKVAAAVDFSSAAVESAIAEGADLLLVHHGMFWSGLVPITGAGYDRLKMLISGNVAVYASHLPLDRHERLGNNVLLAHKLGLTPSGEFARFQSVHVGVSGDADIDTVELARRADAFAREHDGVLRASAIPSGHRTRRWGICTGAGASAETLKEAAERDLDTLIVGEGAHWTAVHAADAGMAILYAGHYATETLGVIALAENVGERFSVPWTFLRHPTGL